MKKIIFITLCILSLFTITGCNSSSDEIEILFRDLTDNYIIPQNLELIDEMSDHGETFGISSNDTYYIYKDKDSNIIAIQYEDKINTKIGYEKIIKIYENVKLNEKAETCDDCGVSYYSYSNGTNTTTSKYEITSYTTYYGFKHNKLFKGKYYTFEKENN